MRAICCAAVLVVAGCQSASPGPGPGPSGPVPSDRPAANLPARTDPPAGQSAVVPGQAARPGWKPGWWVDKPTRTRAGGVQASGTATAGELLEARRQAIDIARASALTLADAGGSERVVQAATNPNANGSFTVWVVLEVGGQ